MHLHRSVGRFLCFLSLLVPLAAVAQPEATGQSGSLGAHLDAVLDAPAFENAFWGVLVADVESGEVLYERNSRKSFVPASNTKLYTTSAALDRFGADYRFVTRVYTDGEIERGVLRGNLVVRGSGDPVIGGRFNGGDRTETFRNWAKNLRDQGIRRITGDLIGDDDLFDDVPLGFGWNWDDETYWYSAELSALSFNDNCVDVTISATQPGRPGVVRWEPHNTTYVQVINETTTLPAGTSLREGYERVRGTNRIVLTSSVPQGTRDPESITVTNPTRYFVYVLKEVLRREGIEVEGEPVDVDDLPRKPDYSRLREVASHTSPPLSQIVEVINKNSQNLYADMLLKLLGTLPAPGEAEPGSHEQGLRVSKDVFGRAGLDTTRIRLVDGSGLSRSNFITPEMSVTLLRYMWSHPDTTARRVFMSSLPIGGVDGTLRSRFSTGPARQNVRAKTGTLGNVSGLAGYVTTASGRVLAFSLMANHYTTPSSAPVRGAQDEIVNALAALRE